MTDPERLLSSGITDFERLVLYAAKREQPSSGQQRRMRRALFFAELGFLTAGFKAIASVGNHLVVVAVIASALVGTGSSRNRESSNQAARPAAPTTVQPALAPSPIGLEPVITDSAKNVVRTEPLALDTKSMEAKGAHRPFVPSKPVDLTEEIRLLDEARMALRTNNPARALTTLNRYLSQFPRGSFHQEASVLRIEALAMNGNKVQAAAEAKTFMAKHPGSPHVEKLTRLTQSPASR